MSSKNHDTNCRPEDLCLSCGLCCDGSIFSVIPLKATSEGKLPLHHFIDKKHHILQLPCTHYIGNKCSIYNTPDKPHTCSQFRCRLLFQLEERESSWEESLATIDNAKVQIGEIQTSLKTLNGYDEEMSLELNVKAVQKKQSLELDSRIKLALVLLKHRALELYFRKHFGVFEKNLKKASLVRSFLLGLNLKFFRALIFIVNKSA